ncbi:uncharacterized protein ASCRUDRAFT_81840 [Ascoidea rubescens DSM 1968]|uniref:Uncharacterized protein n=1 Tax=Ascoidea rubescens DSM 1968 TaxID=1344418 RepID=A0A1D2VD51_9ASCO|nr:hypothetical protein ASCRUDRAFT_81840 [Ascoidea rubescens DSM 1968]ODV59502.1 hypothetical protein ASCRUDRAFT_81840 [Ascoidea rubescens DSM 1968]
MPRYPFEDEDEPFRKAFRERRSNLNGQGVIVYDFQSHITYLRKPRQQTIKCSFCKQDTTIGLPCWNCSTLAFPK